MVGVAGAVGAAAVLAVVEILLALVMVTFANVPFGLPLSKGWDVNITAIAKVTRVRGGQHLLIFMRDASGTIPVHSICVRQTSSLITPTRASMKFNFADTDSHRRPRSIQVRQYVSHHARTWAAHPGDARA